ncbi:MULTISPECIES: phage terminase small subunit [unclassified Dehalobacter]|uniref:phage terminase small subunit n=1 Tax=unclassified Dehalobacter TaxID=2635733 RepID=UPI001052AB69|nr:MULTISPECIES: phage terminase small subunit [unclassified Dehalobacter]TCX51941.1 terminase [Dehalobacter sp. 14DCB1]TCX53001.1 terminase [Dehalobacter sp. 12DCB1]
MPRARSPNREKAHELWLASGKNRLLKDIAAEIGVSETQVRKWKNQDGWDKVTLPKGKDKKKSNVTKKRGGQQGNKNAAGHGAPEGNKNNFKHGVYEKIYWDTLDDDERAMLADMQYEEEQLLQEQIALLSVRERRLMKSIQGKKDAQGGLALESVVSRKLEIKGNVVYDNQQTQVETTTRTISIFEVIQKLEAELTRVQAKKTRCIEALNRLRLERQKLEEGKKGNALVDDWIAGLMGGDDCDDDEDFNEEDEEKL